MGKLQDELVKYLRNTTEWKCEEIQNIKLQICSLEESLNNLLFSLVESEEDYDSAEDIMSDFMGGSFEVEWYEERDIRYLVEMITGYKKLAHTLEIIEQEDEKKTHDAKKALEVLVTEARRIKKDKKEDIQKAEKTISAMDEIIEICDACREWYV